MLKDQRLLKLIKGSPSQVWPKEDLKWCYDIKVPDIQSSDIEVPMLLQLSKDRDIHLKVEGRG